MKRVRLCPLLIHLRDRKILRPCCSSAIRYTNYWSEFPEAVKVEILSKLSEKDLIKLKFVCKEWNFLISTICIPMLSPPNPSTPLWGFLSFEDPPPALEFGERDFDPDPYPQADKYLRLEYSPTRLYCPKFIGEMAGGMPTMRDHIMSLLPSTDASNIIDCCNGLILVAAKSDCYFVGNPVTRQRITIPIPVSVRNSSQSCHSTLAFDPNISTGFKIFRFTRPAVDATPSSPLALEMFSSQCGGWTSHVLPLQPQNLYGFEWIRRSVYFKGSLYYMSMAMFLVCVEPAKGLSADICLRAWAVELPDKSKITMEEAKEGLHGCIGCSLGRFYYSNRDADGNVLVWMLVEKGKNSEWVLKHNISIDHDMVPVRYVEMVDRYKILDSFRPRAFHPTDDAIIMGSSMMLLSYHLKTKCFDLIHRPSRHRRDTIRCDHNQIFPYAQCLLSLYTITSEA